MSENYIHIFTSFLADLLEEKKLTFQQVRDLSLYFAKEADSITSRKDLLKFIDKFGFGFPQLLELKRRLMDDSYVFATPPAAEE